MEISKPLICYFGGKGNMWKKILPYFPQDDSYNTYVEPFGGSGVMLLKKPIKPIEIYNDLELNVYTFYKVLQDENLYKKFLLKARTSVYHELLSKECLLKLRENKFDNDVDRAYVFWYTNRTRRSGLGGFKINTLIQKNTSRSTADFQYAIKETVKFHNRWKNVIVLNRDGIELIKKYDDKNVFMYIDPPYITTQRSSARYLQDVDIEYHKQLIETLNNIKNAKILLSGYDDELYNDLHYNKFSFEWNTVNSKNEPRIKIETLWRNYDC